MARNIQMREPGNAYADVLHPETNSAMVLSPDGSTTVFAQLATLAPLAHVGATGAAHGLATTSVAGFMSSADKTKLDGIEAGANAYTHPTTAGNKHVPSGGSSGQILGWSSDGTAVWQAAPSAGVWGSITGTLSSQSDLQTALNAKVSTNTWPTLTGVTLNSIKNFETVANPNTTSTTITPNDRYVICNPVSQFLWHDLFAFCRLDTPVFETSVDGSTGWTGATLQKELFSHRGTTSYVVLNAAVNKGVRWTWDAGIAWAYPTWLVMGLGWNSDAPSRTVTIESYNGSVWTIRHQSTYNTSSEPVWHYCGGINGDSQMRLTISTAASTGSISIAELRLLTSRWGDQGKGDELAVPYDWDKDGNITGLGTVGGSRLISTIATGTAPLTVTSTTVVSNLNADLLDGLHSTDFAASSHVGATGTAHGLATGSVHGFLSSSDFTKLSGIATGAEVNQNTFSSVAVSGQTTVAADTKTDTLTLVAGTNITITTDAATDSITINSTGLDLGPYGISYNSSSGKLEFTYTA